MRNIQVGMNVERQRRKITHLIDTAPPEHLSYLSYILTLFDAEVEAGRPTPAKEFLGMYEEEYDL
ncbi:hypothetical protein SEA_YECEY3_75 [Mycobacterium phage Yecey3]|uniref:Uncharacterized protein n=1 Tax=Mycobacterium phage Yecey3 TaxID=2656617 RepID=A0A649V928_9CAUD|nr:hypothetical protein KIV58_gp034 [Mycobacterium phage Yecey3]QGJ88826.1 hypothetical protein SEA_YECEY3_75 [Mycobacterium phage Yecey3]